MTKKHRAELALIGLILLVLVGGTFAFWTQKLQVVNEFEIGRYDTSISEIFVSPRNWMPGIQIEKKVRITNDGTIPVIVKVIFHQSWIRKENILDDRDNPIPPFSGQKFPLEFLNESNELEYAAILNFDKDNVRLWSDEKSSDIDNSYGLNIVTSINDAFGYWLLTSDKPDEKGNLYFYYIDVIDSESHSPWLLQSVTMNKKIQPTITHKSITYFDDGDGNITQNVQYTLNPTFGYDNAEYTLSIEAVTVQATKPAIYEVFSNDKDFAWIVAFLAEYVSLTEDSILDQ